MIARANRSELGYYEVILGTPLVNMENVLFHLKQRCDSKLEIVFALCLLSRARGEWIEAPIIEGDFIAIEEPFGTSPTGNGCSRAFFKCQVVSGIDLWDFGIWRMHNNGAGPPDKWDAPSLLVDVDGFGPHKDRRNSDRAKCDRARAKCLKLPEEAFKSVQDMVEMTLFSSIWECGCGFDDDRNYYQCDTHAKFALRTLNNFKRDFSEHDD